MNIKEFLGFCSHKWKETNRENWTKTRKDYYYEGESKIQYTKIELKCSKCGNIKIIEK